MERLSKQKIRVKKSERAEWEHAAKRWPKETIGTTEKDDTEIESLGEFSICPRLLLLVQFTDVHDFTVLTTLESMKGTRPQNSSLDLEYAIVSKRFHKVFSFGDYSITQNNCQDLVVAVAKKSSGKNIDLGSILKPKSARMFSRREVWKSKSAGFRISQQNFAQANYTTGVMRQHHRHIHRSHH